MQDAQITCLHALWKLDSIQNDFMLILFKLIKSACKQQIQSDLLKIGITLFTGQHNMCIEDPFSHAAAPCDVIIWQCLLADDYNSSHWSYNIDGKSPVSWQWCLFACCGARRSTDLKVISPCFHRNCVCTFRLRSTASWLAMLSWLWPCSKVNLGAGCAQLLRVQGTRHLPSFWDWLPASGPPSYHPCSLCSHHMLIHIDLALSASFKGH